MMRAARRRSRGCGTAASGSGTDRAEQAPVSGRCCGPSCTDSRGTAGRAWGGRSFPTYAAIAQRRPDAAGASSAHAAASPSSIAKRPAGQPLSHRASRQRTPSAVATARAGPRSSAASSNAAGSQVRQVEAELLLAVAGIERRAHGARRDRDRGRRHLGAVRQHHGNPVPATDVGMPQRGDDGRRLPPQGTVAQWLARRREKSRVPFVPACRRMQEVCKGGARIHFGRRFRVAHAPWREERCARQFRPTSRGSPRESAARVTTRKVGQHGGRHCRGGFAGPDGQPYHGLRAFGKGARRITPTAAATCRKLSRTTMLSAPAAPPAAKW